MIEPRCPDCLSPEIEPDPHGLTPLWVCGNCGERFDLETAFIRLRESEDFRSEMGSEPMFHLRTDLAEMELRDPDGAIRALSPHSDLEELEHVLDAAAAAGVIEARRRYATLHAYLRPGVPPQPVLVVDPALGARLIGPDLPLGLEPGEDPISYTMRRLGGMVEAANALLAGRLHGAAGSGRTGRPGTEGPRTHRPGPGSGPPRHYIGDARRYRPDGTIGGWVEAEGATISAVLTALGERIESDGADPDGDTLVEASVTWADDGEDVQSAG